MRPPCNDSCPTHTSICSFLHRLLGERQDVNKFGSKMDFLFPFPLKFSGTVLEHQYQWDHILFSSLQPSFFRTETCASFASHIALVNNSCVKWLYIFPVERWGHNQLNRFWSYNLQDQDRDRTDSTTDSVLIISPRLVRDSGKQIESLLGTVFPQRCFEREHPHRVCKEELPFLGKHIGLQDGEGYYQYVGLH